MIWFNRRAGYLGTGCGGLYRLDRTLALEVHRRQPALGPHLRQAQLCRRPRRPGAPPSSSDCILYVGRLSQEKGLGLLLEAWAVTALSNLGRLLIVGDGPERAKLERKAAELDLSPSRVTFLGRRPTEDVHGLLGGARALVAPSLCSKLSARRSPKRLPADVPLLFPIWAPWASSSKMGEPGSSFRRRRRGPGTVSPACPQRQNPG